MSRRLVSLTLDTLAELPRPCRECVFWELEPAAARDACAGGDPALEKEAWVSQALLEWGSCGKLAYVDTEPAGYVIYAPPAYLPRGSLFPTAPVSPDAVLLTAAHVVPGYAGGGLGRALVQAAARDLGRRGVRAIEAFGDARHGRPGTAGLAGAGCVVPAGFFLAVGFKTVRPHPRYPRLRLDLRTALSWKSEVEYALERLLDTMTPEGILPPARPAVPLAWGQVRGASRERSVDTSREPVGTSASTG
jgi:GNAT superfamily N-acetyltransferase